MPKGQTGLADCRMRRGAQSAAGCLQSPHQARADLRLAGCSWPEVIRGDPIRSTTPTEVHVPDSAESVLHNSPLRHGRGCQARTAGHCSSVTYLLGEAVTYGLPAPHAGKGVRSYSAPHPDDPQSTGPSWITEASSRTPPLCVITIGTRARPIRAPGLPPGRGSELCRFTPPYST